MKKIVFAILASLCAGVVLCRAARLSPLAPGCRARNEGRRSLYVPPPPDQVRRDLGRRHEGTGQQGRAGHDRGADDDGQLREQGARHDVRQHRVRHPGRCAGSTFHGAPPSPTPAPASDHGRRCVMPASATPRSLRRRAGRKGHKGHRTRRSHGCRGVSRSGRSSRASRSPSAARSSRSRATSWARTGRTARRLGLRFGRHRTTWSSRRSMSPRRASSSRPAASSHRRRSRHGREVQGSARGRDVPEVSAKKNPRRIAPSGVFTFKSLAVTYSCMAKGHTTIGAERFHFRVRKGIGWFPLAIAARQTGSRTRIRAQR